MTTTQPHPKVREALRAINGPLKILTHEGEIADLLEEKLQYSRLIAALQEVHHDCELQSIEQPDDLAWKIMQRKIAKLLRDSGEL